MTHKTNKEIVCVAEFRAKEGMTDALMAALSRLLPLTHQEKGCIRYELNQRTDDPRWITFVEKWNDQKSFEDHCAKLYITHFFNDERPRLVETFEVKLYREIFP